MELTNTKVIFAQFRATITHYSSIQFSFSELSGIRIPTRNVSKTFKKSKI
jgi:hypothetical protein